jgi:hypothetical protein
MPSYSLEIQFDQAGLQTLQDASQKVSLVKATQPSALPVVWVAFTPEEDNTITWDEEYSVYASTTHIDAGATINTSSTAPAQGGRTYMFQGGDFPSSKGGLPLTQYGIFNNDSDPQFAEITAGLAQVANGSGSNRPNPLNATVVPYNENGLYTPIEKLQVFAAASMNNGLVISEVQGNALLIDFTTNPSQVIHYDDASNTFQLGPLSVSAAARARGK